MPSVYRAKASFFQPPFIGLHCSIWEVIFQEVSILCRIGQQTRENKIHCISVWAMKLLSGIKHLHGDTRWSVTISIYFIAYDNTLIKFKIHIQEKLPLHTLNHDKSSMKQLLPFVLQSSDIQRFIIFFNQAIFSGQRYLQSFVILNSNNYM